MQGSSEKGFGPVGFDSKPARSVENCEQELLVMKRFYMESHLISLLIFRVFAHI